MSNRQDRPLAKKLLHALGLLALALFLLIAAEGKVADEQAAAPQTIGARACGNILDFLNLLNLVERKGVAVEWGVDRDNPVFYYRGKGRGVKGKKDRKHADEHCRDQAAVTTAITFAFELPKLMVKPMPKRFSTLMRGSFGLL